MFTIHISIVAREKQRWQEKIARYRDQVFTVLWITLEDVFM
ncbi:hypothetical protein BLGI_1240 [Brevibacillus laterosporus GI-9]|nr:hypothetical protein BLGI_1240 [Brevibacillus laterosporus GI-9]